MSLFRPYQYKNKPDFPKDAPIKNGFFVFWEIYFRKFWRFLTLNLLFFVTTMPFLFVFYIVATGYFAGSSVLASAGEGYDLFAGIGIFATVMDVIPSFLYIPILIIAIIIYGPLKMGQTYIFRNFAREEHAWLSDVFSRAWSNVKQGLFFGILDVVVISLLIMGSFGNVLNTTATISVISLIMRILAALVLVFYLYMRKYFYLIAVTMELSVFQIIKNAMLFVFIAFGRNVLSGLINLALFIVCIMTLPMITFITLPLFYYSFNGFANCFICYPPIKKFLILPAMQMAKENAGEAPGGPEEITDEPSDREE